MILLHVLIALVSVVCTGYVSFFPSKRKLFLSYGLVGFTVLSGSYLIITKPSHMISTCFEGLLYIGVVSIGIFFAHKRLTALSTKNF